MSALSEDAARTGQIGSVPTAAFAVAFRAAERRASLLVVTLALGSGRPCSLRFRRVAELEC